MTRPTILDLDLVVVPRGATVEMQVAGNFNHDQSPEAVFAAMLSASPYPTAWDDVRKYVEGLEAVRTEELGIKMALREYVAQVNEKMAAWVARCTAAEARIAELEADHLEERLAMSGRIEFLEDASAVPHLEHRIAELEEALDENEVASGLTDNGNLWRFWSTKANALAVRNAELEKRLADAESEPVGTDAEGILRQAIKRAEKVCKSDGGYMPALATLVRILADELADAYPDDTNGGRAALDYMEGK